MNKAKSLSAGYRDNDPPQYYYKRKGLVPPERSVRRLNWKLLKHLVTPKFLQHMGIVYIRKILSIVDNTVIIIGRNFDINKN